MGMKDPQPSLRTFVGSSRFETKAMSASKPAHRDTSGEAEWPVEILGVAWDWTDIIGGFREFKHGWSLILVFPEL